MNSNIKSSSIQIHNDSAICVETIIPSFALEDEDNKKWNFGILQLEMEEVPMTKQPIFIVFDVDMSGSMIETENGGKSRMQHVHNTFENMIRFIASQEVEVYIRVDGFDDTIQNIINPCRVTNANKDELVATIKTMIPRGGTNIGLALKNANVEIQKYKNENPTHKLFHILLTDGAATVGETDPDRLSKNIGEHGVNIFLGVGPGHNTKLLQKFANRKNAEYRFIDNGDNAGMMYGEILQRILRPAIEDVKIEMTCGEIYDWKSNSWQTHITEDVIDSEATKTYHIRTMKPNHVEASIYGSVSDCTKTSAVQELDIVSSIPDLIHEDGSVVGGLCNLAKYLYRQQTLIFLNLCSHFTVDYNQFNKKKEIRTKLANFFRSMRCYMRTNNLLDDSFMRTLCDDIIVAYKTVGTALANMHCTSRNISQGAERSCTTQCEDIEVEDINLSLPPPPMLRRQVARNYVYDYVEEINEEEEEINDEDVDTIKYHSFDLGFATKSKSCVLPLIDEDDIENYITISTNKMDIDNAAYITPGRRQMMRAVSGR